MPSDAVWIVCTVPKKEYELELRDKKKKTKIRYDNNNGDAEETPLEVVLQIALEYLGVEEVSWLLSKNGKYHQVYFHTDLYENDATLAYLQSKGIGTRHQSQRRLWRDNEDNLQVYSTRDSVPATEPGTRLDLGHQKTGFKRIQEDFLKSVTSRLTVAQVVEGVRSSAEMTFDFVMYAIFAGCIAAAGLLNNSAVDVAAAMMIEPVMATVIAMTFGIVVQDRQLTWTGIRSCCISLVICLLVGYIYGAIVFIWWREWDPPPHGVWPTPEMQVRGLWRTLWYGLLQALAAGGAVSVTLLNDNQAALVGVAVASTFLPPFINSGLLWAYTTHITIRGHHQTNMVTFNYSGESYTLPEAWAPLGDYQPTYYADQRWEFMALSGVSMLYTLVNIVGMIAFGALLLKAKEVVPLGSLEPHKKFFREDVPAAREFNRRMTIAAASGLLADDQTMGDQILSEWADIAGLDKDTLLSARPEARVTQLQTLQDILSDVEMDDNYLSVTSRAVGRPNADNLVRRMTMASLGGDRSRRSSLHPSSALAATLSPNGDVQSTPGANTKRRYTLNPKRRGSKWLPQAANLGDMSPSPAVTVNSNGSITHFTFDEIPITRGLRPDELEDRIQVTTPGGRRKSVVFQRTLKDTDHQPFSVWPTGGAAGGGRFKKNDQAGATDLRRRSMANNLLARRMSKLPSLSIQSPTDK
ncbi:hypothetical protein HDE_07844 [Halotydeus destructor]|nr:hypothetical protein HDE_07844 [Halotydeus destructor]